MTTTNEPAAEPGGTTAPPSSRLRGMLVTGGCALLAVALVAVATAAIRAGAAAAPRPPAAATPSVRTLVPARLDGYEVRRAYAARVEPAREVTLSFETGGTLAEVAADEGDRVSKGAVVARLDTRLLAAKRAQLAAAREALDSDAELADLALTRQRGLRERGFAADEALDAARLSVARTASRTAEADAALALVDVELDKAVLRAPFDALVGARALDPGTALAAGAPVLALLHAGTPRLRVGLPPERAAALDADRTYAFVAGSREIPARLVARRGDVDVRTRTVSALFEPVGGAGDALFLGELLELALTERVEADVLDVPLTALAEDERGLWSVMAVVASAGNGDGIASLRRVAVDVVHLAGDRAFVSGALPEGAPIVAAGRHRAVDGERVRIARPAGSTGDGTRGRAAAERGA